MVLFGFLCLLNELSRSRTWKFNSLSPVKKKNRQLPLEEQSGETKKYVDMHMSLQVSRHLFLMHIYRANVQF